MAVENDVVMKLGVEEASELQSAWSSVGGSLGSIVAATTSWLIPLGIVTGTVLGIKSALNFLSAEYIQSAEAARHLNLALDNAIRNSNTLAGATRGLRLVFSESAAAMSATSTASDDQIMALQRQALNYGILTYKVNETVQAALNFAAATGTDVQTAMMRLVQASNGVYMGWRKWGIEVDETKGKLVNFDSILEQVNKRFGGAAQAEMQSYTGRVQEMGKAWSDFWKARGQGAAFIKDEWVGIFTRLLRSLTPEKLPTGPELAAMDEGLRAQQAEEKAAKEKAAFEEQWAKNLKKLYKEYIDLSNEAKRGAETEKDNLRDAIQLQNELKNVTAARYAQAESLFSRLAKENVTMSAQEKRRAKAIYESIEAGGVGAYEALPRKQREWYAGTAVGQEQLAGKKVFETMAERDQPWIRGAAGATKLQVDAAIKNELLIKIVPDNPALIEAISKQATDQLAAWLTTYQNVSRKDMEMLLKRAAGYEEAAAATGGNK